MAQNHFFSPDTFGLIFLSLLIGGALLVWYGGTSQRFSSHGHEK